MQEGWGDAAGVEQVVSVRQPHSLANHAVVETAETIPHREPTLVGCGSCLCEMFNERAPLVQREGSVPRLGPSVELTRCLASGDSDLLELRLGRGEKPFSLRTIAPPLVAI